MTYTSTQPGGTGRHAALHRTGTLAALSGVEVKGTGLLQSVEYLEKTQGARTVAEVLNRLSDPARRSARFAMPNNMYPVEHVAELLAACQEVLGPGDPDLLFQLSLATARSSFSLLFKVFMRFGNPRFIVDRCATLFRANCSHGQLEVAAFGPGHTTLRLTGFPYRNADYCAHRLRAWFQAPLELSGCRILESTHPQCATRGDPCCEWRYAWVT